ncbi:hypothetical protein CTEN210_03748 [Chaetoceros tenuissimus]|uniref:Fe2OG dioxygenase domain-containing protein n=1 Tax=Chaetoceros tenuissimus TaxID=426638 RepID=A0AAD3CJX1_9STRA|nr:hypothetical protein CTEN210_03748 [Chaetoceros tenuissimus]
MKHASVVIIFLYSFIYACDAFVSTRHGIKSPFVVGLRQSTQDVDTVIPRDILGPPEPLKNLQIGQKIDAFRRILESSTSMERLANFTIERVSYTPDAFVMHNFLTESECLEIQNSARKAAMTRAETITENDTKSRKNCEVAWLPSSRSEQSHQHSNLIPSLVSSVANIFLSPAVLSNPSAGVEDLQVLRYGTGGEFVLHHDGEPRTMTVIYYLNGVGGTWFPLARTSNDVNEDPCTNMNTSQMDASFYKTRSQPQNKQSALDLGKDFQPRSHGLLVEGGRSSEEDSPINQHVASIKQGDALVFYNYCDDGSGRLNWRALHAGLPTAEEDGEKWIANHWFRVNDLTEIS